MMCDHSLWSANMTSLSCEAEGEESGRNQDGLTSPKVAETPRTRMLFLGDSYAEALEQLRLRGDAPLQICFRLEAWDQVARVHSS